MPIMSRPYERMSCNLFAATTLMIEDSGPGVWPFDSAVMPRNLVNFRPCERT